VVRFLKITIRKTILSALNILLVATLAFALESNSGETSQTDPKRDRLIYDIPFKSEQDIHGWIMEGPGKITFKEDWMHIYSPEEKWHHVFWCPHDLPDSFVAELEAQNMETDAGLCIIFFAAKGVNGKDIFDANLPKRDGTFRQYTKGNSSPGKHQLNEIAKLNRRIFITG